MTATVKEGTPGIEDLGLIKNYSYIFVSTAEETYKGKNIKLLKMWNPFDEGDWKGDYSPTSEKWQDEALAKKFNFTGPSEDNNDKTCYISFDDLRQFFRLINILVPMRPCICQTLNIPKEKADAYNILKVKFEKKGIFSLGIQRQITRFHKDLKEDHDMIENVLFAKIYKEDKK